MALIVASEHFQITTPEQPHVARGDGGHLIINPKAPVEDRTRLTREQAVELMKLTMVAGEAMKNVLTQHGIDIGRINYQDNGNWRHELHVHLYGRAKSAKVQKWGTFLQLPPTREAFLSEMGDLEPLTPQDVAGLAAAIGALLRTEKYRDF